MANPFSKGCWFCLFTPVFSTVALKMGLGQLFGQIGSKNVQSVDLRLTMTY